MRILVACEYSGTVSSAFRAQGHHVISCDILQTEREDCRPYHWVGDALELIHHPKGWDLVIAHPPCTCLSIAGVGSWPEKQMDGRQDKAIDFFMALYNAPATRVCVENPVGIMSTVFRKPDQYVQPWWFGDPWMKKTGLWLKNLPPLVKDPTASAEHAIPLVDGGSAVRAKWGEKITRAEANFGNTKAQKAHLRSKFFPGIARAMADQWGALG